jgi:hypothetical protein
MEERTLTIKEADRKIINKKLKIAPPKLVTITITDKVLGKTKIGIIGSEGYSPSKKRIKLEVGYYQVNIEGGGIKKSTYYMTRDAPVMNTDNPYHIEKTKKKVRIYPWYDPFDWAGPHYKELIIEKKYLNVINAAFEPKGEFQFKAAVVPNYLGYKAHAFALKNMKGKNELKAYPVNLPKDKSWNHYRRKDPNYATEVMLHIGGALNSSGSTIGSVGCFTATDKDKGEKGMMAIFNDVRKRSPYDSSIRINIKSRPSVKWNYRVLLK